MSASGPSAPRSGPPRGGPNEDNLLSLGRAIDRRNGGATRLAQRRRRRSRALRWTGLGLACVLVLGIAGVAAAYYYLGHLVAHRQVNYEQSESGGAVNILLVGSTDRCALKHQNAAYGLCEDGVDGVNSDIVMIAHLEDGHASLISIPRDLFEPNARVGGNANKIDAALFDGPSQLAAAIEEDFGIPINHFVELNFDTFASVVDDVGGIDMYFPVRVYDAESGLNIERPGCYHLDGVHALQVVRARHLQIGFAQDGDDPHLWPQEVQSDLARIRRTHEFLRVIAAKISSLGIGDVSRDWSLATTILPDLTVDNGFSEGEMVSLANEYHSVNISQVEQLTYPVLINQADPQNGDSYLYDGYYYGDVEFPIQPGGWQAVDSVFGAAPDLSSWNDEHLPLAGAFHVSVEDASGVPGEQSTVATELDQHGFDVTQTGVRASTGPTSETVVWYGGPPPPKNGDWKSASLLAAQRVMTWLQGPVTLGYDPAMVTRGDMVTVQTGSDLTVATRDWAAPPTTTTTSSTTTTTAGPTSSTSSTTTVPHVTASTVYDPPGVRSDNNFSAPSDTAQPLEPWDPRACTPGMLVRVDRSGDG